MTEKAIAYYRVSTAKQGASGLGLEAQQAAVHLLCKHRDWEIITELTEVESGKNDERPRLKEALNRAKVTGATLVVAKLDRLSRNVAFLATLQESKARFIAADMPEANEFSIHIMAAVAQFERKAISERTRVALQAKKAQGKKLGNPNGAAALRRAAKGNAAAVAVSKAKADSFAKDLEPMFLDVIASGARTLRAIAAALNERHAQTPRGCKWSPGAVARLMQRMPAPPG